MRFHFNPNVISWFFVFFMPMALAAFFWQVILFTFAFPLQQEKTENSLGLKSAISFSSLFSSDKIGKKEVTTNASMINANTFKLKALYEDDVRGFILIESKGQTDFVSLNETYKGYTLITIASDYATLKKDTKEYILNLNQIKERKRISNKDETRVELETQILETLNRSDLSVFQQDIKQLWENIRIQPYNVDNELAGYEVSFIKRDSLFEKMGLKKGDNLQSINGTSVKDTAKVMQMYGSLDSYDSLHLEILRNKEAKDLYYELH